jgi:hypothetical protein
VEAIPIKHNNTIMVIGEIKHLLMEERLLKTDGNVDLEIANATTVAGLETYYISSILQKIGYAKVAENPFAKNA